MDATGNGDGPRRPLLHATTIPLPLVDERCWHEYYLFIPPRSEEEGATEAWLELDATLKETISSHILKAVSSLNALIDDLGWNRPLSESRAQADDGHLRDIRTALQSISIYIFRNHGDRFIVEGEEPEARFRELEARLRAQEGLLAAVPVLRELRALHGQAVARIGYRGLSQGVAFAVFPFSPLLCGALSVALLVYDVLTALLAHLTEEWGGPCVARYTEHERQQAEEIARARVPLDELLWREYKNAGRLPQDPYLVWFAEVLDAVRDAVAAAAAVGGLPPLIEGVNTRGASFAVLVEAVRKVGKVTGFEPLVDGEAKTVTAGECEYLDQSLVDLRNHVRSSTGGGGVLP